LLRQKNTGFVKSKLPRPAYELKGDEIEKYPNCRRVLGHQDFQRWLSMKTAHDLKMSKKELNCRLHKLDLQEARIDALSTTVKSAKHSLETIKGATRCVLHPTLRRVFKMLDGETQVVGPKLKTFIQAVEQQRKVMAQLDNSTQTPKPTQLFYTSRDLRDPFDSLGDGPFEVKSLDGDLGESVETKSHSPMSRLELGAELAEFEGAKVRQYKAEKKEEEDGMASIKKKLVEKTKEVKDKNSAAVLKEQAAKQEKHAKAAERHQKKAPETKYTCLYAEFEKLMGPSAKKLSLKYKTSRKAVNSQLNKLKGLLEKSEQEAPEGKPPAEGKTRFLGSSQQQPALQVETFVSSAPFKIPVEKYESDLGESADATELPGCSAFYASAGPQKAKKAPAKPKADIPAPTGDEEQDLGESSSIDSSSTKSLEGKQARNPRDLRLKVQKYVTRMARRAARVSDKMLDDARRLLQKARIQAKKLKTQVKNAQSLVKVVRTQMGTVESVSEGQCLGNTCYRGMLFKTSHNGVEQTWICHRGFNAKREVRNAFACTMKTAEGDAHSCAGKELRFTEFWVPFLKETTCPADITRPCGQAKQCGSEALPLTRDYVQQKIRTECAQL